MTMAYKTDRALVYRNGRRKHRGICTPCISGTHRHCNMQYCNCICKDADIQAVIANNQRLESECQDFQHGTE